MSPRSQTRPLWITAVAVPLLFAAIAALQARIDARTRSLASEKEELLLRSPAVVKKMSLGYDPLMADIYWTRAVQYYGERLGTSHADFQLLWPLLDLATTLDPKLMVAYRFGAIFLSEKGEAGAGRPDLAVGLVKRGIAENPDEWRLYSDLGFLYYWWLKDYPNAAAAYLEGSKNPKAGIWMKMMAARVAEKGGSFETSRMIWSEVYESTKDPAVRKRAFQQLRALKAQQDEMYLDQIAEDYRQRFGHSPSSMRELRDAGLLRGVPVDPAGFPYTLGPDGKSGLAPQSPIVIDSSPNGPPR